MLCVKFHCNQGPITVEDNEDCKVRRFWVMM